MKSAHLKNLNSLFPIGLACLLVGCNGDTPPSTAGSNPESSSGGVESTAPAPKGGQGADAFATAALAKVEDGKPSIQGDDPNWFFLNRELKQLGLGAFWEKDFAEVATNKTDPTESIVEFHNLLKEKGIELLVVPVPAKGAIYPDKLVNGFGIDDPAAYAPFYETMRAQGVNVLDFEPIARNLRAEGAPGLYCSQDTHFSPYTAQLLAGEIAQQFAQADWATAAATGDILRGPAETLTITGDQVKGSEWEGNTAQESLPVIYAGTDNGGRIEPVPASDESPVLLIGDSHTLVFSEGGDMHAKGAGLRDQLQAEFGFPLAHVGVRGSGLVQARRQLYQKAAPNPAFWEGKKLVVWVFSVREFTQSYDKILSIPIEKK